MLTKSSPVSTCFRFSRAWGRPRDANSSSGYSMRGTHKAKKGSIATLASPDGPLVRADGDDMRQRFLALGPRFPDPNLSQASYQGSISKASVTSTTSSRASRGSVALGRSRSLSWGAKQRWSTGRTRDWDVLCKACECLVSQIAFYGPDWQSLPARSVAGSVARRGRFREDWARIQILADPKFLGTVAYQWAVERRKGFDGVQFLKRSRLKTLLPELRPTQATEPIDKVLALTGFAHDDGRTIVFLNGKNQVRLLYLTVVKY